MLLKILICCGIGLTVISALVITIAGIPLYRSMSMAENLIKIYDEHRRLFKEQNRLPYTIAQGNVWISFFSPKELCEKYETLAQETIKFLKRWGFIAMKNTELLEKRNRLVTICKEIDRIRNEKL